MPYGVPDDLWASLPADDQAAVKAAYLGEPAPQIGPYAAPAPPEGQASQPDQTGGRDLQAFIAANLGPVNPADAVLPSTAWGDLRDYLSGIHPDLPNLPAKRRQIVAHGRDLAGVVASDLWPRRNP